MKIFIDGLGHEYHVATQHLDEFERRHRRCLVLAIVIKVAIVGALIWVGHLGI